MESEKRTLSPRAVLILFCAVEILMGISYYGIVLLQDRNSIFCPILQALFGVLHAISFLAAFAVAYHRVTEKRLGRAYLTVGAFLAALLVKDMIGNTLSEVLRGGYEIGDALLRALLETALYTLLLDGLFLFGVFSLLWLLFFYQRNAPDLPPASLLSLSGDPVGAACLCAVICFGVRLLVRQTVDTVSFGEEMFWYLKTSEILSITLDYVLIPLSCFAAYAVTWLLRRNYTKP